MEMKPIKYAVWCMLCSVGPVTVAQAETTLPYPDIADTFLRLKKQIAATEATP
jgi:hypothetical protein